MAMTRAAPTARERFAAGKIRFPAVFPRVSALDCTAPARAVAAAAVVCVALSGCAEPDRPSVPPAISLTASTDAVEEADHGTVQVGVRLTRPRPPA